MILDEAVILDEIGNVAHYSSLNNLANILHDQHIKLGSINSLDDPRESSLDWISLTGYGSAKAEIQLKYLNDVEKIKDSFGEQLKIFCTADIKSLSKGGDCLENSIYGRPRMWSQYGDNSKGFCILLDKQKFTEQLLKVATKPEYLLKDNINYVAWLSLVQGWADIPYGDDFKSSEIDVFNTVNSNGILKSIFFKKSIDWSGENEYRWLLFNETKDDVFIAINEAIKGVVLGLNFPSNQVSQVQEYCRHLKCPCFSLEYKHPQYKLKEIEL